MMGRADFSINQCSHSGLLGTVGCHMVEVGMLDVNTQDSYDVTYFTYPVIVWGQQANTTV